MTPNKIWFISYSEVWPKEKIFLGGENSYEIARKKVVVVELRYGSKKHVENVYHIAGLKTI